MDVGFALVRKGEQPDDSDDPLLSRVYAAGLHKDRGLTLSVRRSLLHREDRVLMVDDWIETGAQATAVRALVTDAGADWVGVAVMVDESSPDVRRRLTVRSLLHERAL